MAAVMQMLGASDPLKTAVLAEAALGERYRLSCPLCSQPQRHGRPTCRSSFLESCCAVIIIASSHSDILHQGQIISRRPIDALMKCTMPALKRIRHYLAWRAHVTYPNTAPARAQGSSHLRGEENPRLPLLSSVWSRWRRSSRWCSCLCC